MSKTITVCGFGSGISSAVAEKFGAEGFQVALVARTPERLDAGVKALTAKGIKAAAFPTDLFDPSAAAGLVARVKAVLGAPTVIHWNAYGGGAGDLLTADSAAVRRELDVAVLAPLALVQAALPDLTTAEGPAVLLTNGGFGKLDPQVDAYGVAVNAMGLSLANAAKSKLTGLLHAKLQNQGIYVAEVIVLGTVKGTAWDTGNATLEASRVADTFWSMYVARADVRGEVS